MGEGTYGSRLRAERERAGLSQANLATELGVSKNTMIAYENDRTSLNTATMAKIDEIGLDLHFIVFGKRLTKDLQSSEEVSETVPIRVLDLAYGLGGTFIDEHAEERVEQFPKSLIAGFTKSPADKLRLVRGIGDSMKPTLSDGDLLLIDLAQNHLRMSDQIWALAIGEVGMVKRLRVLGGGQVEALSDNPHVSDYLIAEDDCQLVGRVVACLRSL
ncbi:LexA family transcriptional regulator [Alteriqipengyuania flavescens]|uniref:LexA family transcriptional regulator n=1 Tax=Alteriqipengyuania flavescens TaxID=3053610 RepID=UPI0025B4F4B9|nr:LexA family transcriptional regulator [Alteriqipengyuania flavescens]WJY18689.1 LexA family transcriptional regulator [Alteriqipengyuania flavescens]WJY24629.1 LexA family transcriptional regulator [Alteriqipengyuania flavescens]